MNIPSAGRASVNQLNFGTVSGPWQVGGDYRYASSSHVGSNSLANDATRVGAFARASCAFTPTFEVFARASDNRFEGLSYYQQTPTSGTTIPTSYWRACSRTGAAPYPLRSAVNIAMIMSIRSISRPSSMAMAPFNFAEQKASGIDFEASYRRPIGPGALVLRGLATYSIKNVTNNGIDAPNEVAGVNAAGGIPTLTYRATLGYDFDGGLSALFVRRGFTDGVYNNDYIECTTGCPASGPVARTINRNDIAGTFYLDANVTYDIDLGPVQAQALFAVKNVFDRDPVLIGNGPDGNDTPAYPQTNRVPYDTLGRTFRLGLRIRY